MSVDGMVEKTAALSVEKLVGKSAAQMADEMVF